MKNILFIQILKDGRHFIHMKGTGLHRFLQLSTRFLCFQFFYFLFTPQNDIIILQIIVLGMELSNCTAMATGFCHFINLRQCRAATW